MKDRNKEHQQSQDENHPSQDEVARRAYELYRARGDKPGHEVDDWLQAEREINKHREAAHSG
jgi:hypothetical protein